MINYTDQPFAAILFDEFVAHDVLRAKRGASAMITKLSALVLSVVIGLPMIEPAFASDPMAGIWDSRLGDRFEIKDGKIRTRGAFGRYQGTKGLVMSPLSQQHATPMQCELELFDATTLKGICTGGRFINAYEFKAFKIGSGA